MELIVHMENIQLSNVEQEILSKFTEIFPLLSEEEKLCLLYFGEGLAFRLKSKK